MKPKTILLIDDNSDFLTTMSMALQCFDYHVEVAHTGKRGIEIYEEQSPDIVICDIGLPDIDGYEVAARVIRLSNIKQKNVFLVALSGYSQDLDKESGNVPNFSAYLTKPVDLEDLLKIL